MKFLNVDCKLVHGNLRIGSIYTTMSGEWKLGGFETLSALNDEYSVFLNLANRLPNLGKYMAPGKILFGIATYILSTENTEVVRGQGRLSTPAAIDGFAFACLIHEVFNGAFSRAEDLGNRGSIPLVGSSIDIDS